MLKFRLALILFLLSLVIVLAFVFIPESKDKWYVSPDWWVAIFTGLVCIATTGLWIFTYKLFRATVDLGREAKTAGIEQSNKMQASIAEAARAASAMEGVSISMAKNTKLVAETVGINKEIAARQKLVSEMQLRAYISVVNGNAIYQDDLRRFEAQPVVMNSGQTPATKVICQISAAVLPVPLPENFVFPSDDISTIGEGMIPPHQNRSLNKAVKKRVADADVPKIMVGDGIGLYCWGSVSYEDTFGGKQRTEFCQHLTFLPNGSGGHIINGYYIGDRNKAT